MWVGSNQGNKSMSNEFWIGWFFGIVTMGILAIWQVDQLKDQIKEKTQKEIPVSLV